MKRTVQHAVGRASLRERRVAAASPRLSTLFEGGTSVLLASVFGNGLNYLFLVFLARHLDMEDFGLYALGLAVFTTVLLLLTAGLDTAAVKFTAEHRAGGNTDAAKRAILAVLAAGAGLSVVATSGLVVLAGPLATGLYAKPRLAGTLLYFASALPPAVMTAVLLSALQAHDAVRHTVLVRYVWEPLGKWAFAGLGLVAGLGLAGVVGGLIATFAVSVIIGGTALVRIGRVTFLDVVALRTADFRALAAYCAPLLISNVFGVAAPRMDVMTLGYWVPSQEVGVYLVSFQTAAVLALVLGAFDIAFAPMMSRAWATRDQPAFDEGYRAVHRLSLMVAVPLFVLLWAFSGEFLSLFGDGFASGATVLIILACGHVANCAAGSSNTVLLMTGRTKLVMANTIVYGLTLIAGTILLVPLWGIAGAALSASMCFVGLNALRVWQVWRLYRVWPWGWIMLKPLGAGVAMAAFLCAVKSWVPYSFYLPSAGAACLLYLMALYVARLEKDDRQVLVETWSKVRLAFA